MSVNKKKSLFLLIVAVAAVIALTTISFAAWHEIKGNVDITASSGDWNNSAAHVTFDSVMDGGEIVGYSLATFNQSVAELDIPAVHNDLPVVSVASTFTGYASLIRLTLPSSIVKIAPLALSGMDNLTVLNLGDEIIDIGDSAIYNCKKLQTVTLPATVKTIGQFALSYCDAMTNINIKATQANVTVASSAMTFKQGQNVKIAWGVIL